MPKRYIRIPAEYFEELKEAWMKVSTTAYLYEDETDRLEAVIPSRPTLQPADVIWVDPERGHDSNDGLSAGSSVQTWGRVFSVIKPGSLVLLRPGIYRQPINTANLGGTERDPIYFKAEVPGTAVFCNNIQDTGMWELHGNGIYERINRVRDLGPWCGFSKDTFLPRYQSLYDLKGTRIADNLRMPKYGFAQDGHDLFVRLPGRGDPNKEGTGLSANFAHKHISIRNSPYTIFEGIRFRGHGTGFGIFADGDSHHVWIQNCISEHGRVGFHVGPDSVITHCQYGQPGFDAFVNDMMQLNGGALQPVIDYVRKYNNPEMGTSYEGCFYSVENFGKADTPANYMFECYQTEVTHRHDASGPLEPYPFTTETPGIWNREQ